MLAHHGYSYHQEKLLSTARHGGVSLTEQAQGRPLRSPARKAIPCPGMPSTTTSDLSATRDQVLAHRAQLRQMASEEGLSKLRVDVAGTVIAHTDAPGYGPLRRFATAASGLVGAWVNVVTDDVPAAEVSASAL